MKKVIKLSLVVLGFIFLAGCSDKSDESFHYKPEIYKHDSALVNADNLSRKIGKEIADVETKSSSSEDIVNAYKESVQKLKDQLSKLEEKREILKDETNLTKHEKKTWDDRYKEMINAYKDDIKNIKQKEKEFSNVD